MSVVDEMPLPGLICIQLVHGDITERHVDAIINAANSYLKHGGGVAGAIVRKGGRIIQQESDRIGYVPVGSAAATSAGKLPCKAVIHAVGPMMGEGDEDNKLRSALKSALSLASNRGYTSVAIPAISSGIFGFPKDRCAEVLVDEAIRFVRDQSTPIKRIEFCIIDEETIKHFQDKFDRVKKSSK